MFGAQASNGLPDHLSRGLAHLLDTLHILGRPDKQQLACSQPEQCNHIHHTSPPVLPPGESHQACATLAMHHMAHYGETWQSDTLIAILGTLTAGHSNNDNHSETTDSPTSTSEKRITYKCAEKQTILLRNGCNISYCSKSGHLCTTTIVFYDHYTGQPALAGNPS